VAASIIGAEGSALQIYPPGLARAEDEGLTPKFKSLLCIVSSWEAASAAASDCKALRLSAAAAVPAAGTTYSRSQYPKLPKLTPNA